MPIYEYRCKECHQLFEEWCKRVEENNVSHTCPICKGQADRIISNTSFALKGGGWYVTEYGGRKEQKEEGTVTSCAQGKPADAVSGPASPPQSCPAPAAS